MGLSSYIQLALSKASYKILEDKTYFGEILAFQGVWANEKTLEQCRNVLQEVLEDWIVLKLRSRDRLPPIGGKSLSLPHPVGA
ncbi:MAG: type II toxin-antitoxin system HicB family antitoxin [Elusimicrobia bacterium]|nr:type II toxin-antitoxin system HicB family antitoxin [Elusimicrobiota bacterium]